MGIYVSRDAVKSRLTEEWDKYANERVSVKIVRMKPEMAKLAETWDFKNRKGLKNEKDVLFYKEYLNCADKELNILRKYVKQSMDARREAFERLNKILPLLKFYNRYINGEVQFKKEHDETLALYNYLHNKGYNLAELYKYQCVGEILLDRIDSYKRHIFVEKKICDRLEHMINELVADISYKSRNNRNKGNKKPILGG